MKIPNRSPVYSILTAVFSSIYFLAGSFGLSAQTMSPQTFNITLAPSENGSYSITPEIPQNSKVPAGTVLTINAKPAPGYDLDAIFYTVKGGMWGTTSYEIFSSPMKITVDKDMSVGATFVETALVKDIEITQDVVYAKPGLKPLKYDVFSPKGAHNLPGIVIIHGGGWSSNNEDIMRGLARELIKDRRYVVFSIDYRWINQLDGDATPNYMHHLIEDVFGAIVHIQENAKKYGLDPSRLAITGDSAGGHLAGAAALLSPMIGDAGFGARSGVYEYLPSYIPKGKAIDRIRQEITEAVKAVAPSYGIYDAKHFANFLEQKDEEYHHAVSPARYIPNIEDRPIPHFIVRGTQDVLITHEMIQSDVDLLEAAGQRVEYIQVENAHHAFFDWKPDAKTRATFARYGVKNAEKMRRFFDSVFYGKD